MFYKRKTKKKRPRRKTTIARLPRNLGTVSGLPKTRTITLRYTQSLFLASALGIIQESRYRANGIEDPWYETGGHSPMGFDTWATMYNHYIVNKSTITVKAYNDEVSPYKTTVLGVYLSDDAVAPYTTYDAYIEANRGTHSILPKYQNKAMTLRSTYDAKKFFNVSDVKDNFDRFGALTSTNPTESAIYHIYIQSVDTVSTTPTLRGTVTIDYNVTFSEPKDLAQS